MGDGNLGDCSLHNARELEKCHETEHHSEDRENQLQSVRIEIRLVDHLHRDWQVNVESHEGKERGVGIQHDGVGFGDVDHLVAFLRAEESGRQGASAGVSPTPRACFTQRAHPRVTLDNTRDETLCVLTKQSRPNLGGRIAGSDEIGALLTKLCLI